MSENTVHTCAIFFKVTGDEALEAVTSMIDKIVISHGSMIRQAVEENVGPTKGPFQERKRLSYPDARARVKVSEDLMVYRNGSWEKS